MSTVYVGNLDHDVTEHDLREAFAPYGAVESVRIAKSRGGRLRGFAYVELETQAAADAAIEGLRGTALKGRTMDVAADQGGGGGRKGGGGFRRGGGRKGRR
jgi:RNA recognition motif-containing protein